VKNRIFRFDPKLKPEVREREDPSIQCDPPNHSIRESWHIGTSAARSHALLSLPFAALRRPNLHVSPVPSRFLNWRLLNAISAWWFFLTAYCVLRTATVGFVSQNECQSTANCSIGPICTRSRRAIGFVRRSFESGRRSLLWIAHCPQFLDSLRSTRFRIALDSGPPPTADCSLLASFGSFRGVIASRHIRSRLTLASFGAFL
jgi:hypothetical protein